MSVLYTIVLSINKAKVAHTWFFVADNNNNNSAQVCS